MKIVYLLLLISIWSKSSMAQTTMLTMDGKRGLVISYNGIERLTGGSGMLNGKKNLPVTFQVIDQVAVFQVISKGNTIGMNDYVGISFHNPFQYKSGICFWRYKPWNSWTKPVREARMSEMPEDDVQFFYFQYSDSLYAAVLPLSGNGFRTCLGSYGEKWGSKSRSYVSSYAVDSIPSVAVAFGRDSYALFEKIYRVSLNYMNKGNDRRVLKTFPKVFNYLGWCTWNASDNGKKLNEDFLLKAARSFAKKKIPVGWFLLDDGWFQQSDKRLQSYMPDPARFPDGFKPVIDKLKRQYRIKYVGVWHAFNGLWNGIDPASALGRHFKSALFCYNEPNVQKESGLDEKRYYFIRPDSDSLKSFYYEWYAFFKKQGFDFVKVDNQRVVEEMTAGEYPIFTLSDSMHKALYDAANKYFDGAVINCMDMTPEAYLNFGSSAVARSVEDYFPYTTPKENYDLQKGNVAAHVVQAVYNSVYFSQMVFPDFDIFQSHNPNAVFSAIARALNCGPIYITDNIGEQNTEVLKPLVFSDGRIIHSETPLLPTEDCLFQIQDPKLFKAFSMVRNVGLLGVWNAADANEVRGIVKATDVHGITGNDFIIYEFFSHSFKRVTRDSVFEVRLPRMAYRLYYVIPVKKNFAAIGLINKYNAPATILDETIGTKKVKIKLYEGGTFASYSNCKPIRILINSKKTENFTYQNQLLTVNVPEVRNPVLTFIFAEPGN